MRLISFGLRRREGNDSASSFGVNYYLTTFLGHRFPVSRQAVDLKMGIRFQCDLDSTSTGRNTHRLFVHGDDVSTDRIIM